MTGGTGPADATAYPLSKATGADRSEILELWDEHILRHRFGHGWEAIESHVYCGRSPEVYEHCLVARDRDRRIVSVLAALPMTLSIRGAALGTTVITGVVTRPEYRGIGLMTRLIEAALDPTANSGRPLALLWGHRDRYRRFGFEICGGLKRSYVPARKLPPPAAEDAARVRELVPAEDADAIGALGLRRNLVPDGVGCRPSDLYRRALQRTYVFERGAARAMATVNVSPVASEACLEVLHVAGDPGALQILLGALMMTGEYGECAIVQPVHADDDVSRWLFEMGEWLRIEHVCNIRINSLVTLMDLVEPHIAPALDDLGLSVRLGMTRDRERQEWSRELAPGARCVAAELSDTEMVRLLFGPERPNDLPFLTDEVRALDGFLPVPFYVSPLETL